MLQDSLPVKFQAVKFKDSNIKHEIFIRIDMKHSYFSNHFMTCFQSFFYCLVFAKNVFMLMHKFLFFLLIYLHAIYLCRCASKSYTVAMVSLFSIIL